MTNILNEIAEKEDLSLKNTRELAGGDTNAVFEMETSTGKLVVKIRSNRISSDMFEKEQQALEKLSATHTFKIPKIISQDETADKSYLLMEKIESGKQKDGFWKKFAEQLAALHQSSQQTFGWEADNYIGLLPQYNKSESTNAAEFYIEKRLKPQFEMAAENGYTFSFTMLDNFYKKIEPLIPDEKPALIHGDLWRSNYLTSKNNEPVLIDPAIAYAPREMDLAMMKLFGGFDSKIFDYYHEIFPLEDDWEERIGIWQLYYQLVHLNIFGFGYLKNINDFLQRF